MQPEDGREDMAFSIFPNESWAHVRYYLERSEESRYLDTL